MKSLMKTCVLSVAMLMLMCGAAGADDFHPQGNVMIPGIVLTYGYSTSYTFTDIEVSNITDKTVRCRVTMYDQDGNDATSYTEVRTGGTSDILLSSGTGNFEIPPHATRLFTYRSYTPISLYGHAVIEWTSDDPKLHKALIGALRMWGMSSTNVAFSGNANVNNSHPF